jgi:hypothetical protein
MSGVRKRTAQELDGFLNFQNKAVGLKMGQLRTLKSANNNEEIWSDIELRDNLMENMLILLNSAASLGFGPHPDEFKGTRNNRTLSAETRNTKR